jgi:hypothetical protein
MEGQDFIMLGLGGLKRNLLGTSKNLNDQTCSNNFFAAKDGASAHTVSQAVADADA